MADTEFSQLVRHISLGHLFAGPLTACSGFRFASLQNAVHHLHLPGKSACDLGGSLLQADSFSAGARDVVVLYGSNDTPNYQRRATDCLRRGIAGRARQVGRAATAQFEGRGAAFAIGGPQPSRDSQGRVAPAKAIVAAATIRRPQLLRNVYLIYLQLFVLHCKPSCTSPCDRGAYAENVATFLARLKPAGEGVCSL